MQPAQDTIAGFKRLTDFNQPYKLTPKDRVAMILDSSGDFTVFKILFARKDTVVLARVDSTPGHYLKTTIGRVVTAADAATRWVYVPEDSQPPAAVVAVKRTRPAAGETKIAKCKAIYAANRSLDRAAIVALFISEAGCTAQGAVTYYLTCAKD